MSLDAFRDTRSHRQRVLLGVWLAALLSICLIALLIAILITLLRKPAPIVVLDKPLENLETWAPVDYCLHSSLAFVRSRSTECQRVGGEHSACKWDFKTDDGQDLQSLLRSFASDRRGIYSMLLYAGHDSLSVRPGSALDSNFDLASQRGIAIADFVRKIADAESVPLPRPVVLASSHVERLCRPSVAMPRENLEDLRRSPIIQITRWTQEP